MRNSKTLFLVVWRYCKDVLDDKLEHRRLWATSDDWRYDPRPTVPAQTYSSRGGDGAKDGRRRRGRAEALGAGPEPGIVVVPLKTSLGLHQRAIPVTPKCNTQVTF